LRRAPSTRVQWISAAVVTALALVSFGVRAWAEPHQAARLVNTATRSGIYRFSLVSDVDQQCDAVAQAVRAAHADAAVLLGLGEFATDNASALGCEALSSTHVPMLDVPQERRAWRLRAATNASPHSIVVGPVDPGFCAIAARRFAGCEQSGNFAAVHVASGTLTNALALLDLPVRPFGTGCVLTVSSLASSLLRCGSGTDARLAFPTRGAAVDPGSPLFAALTSAVTDANIESGLAPGASRALTGVLANPVVSLRDAFATGPTTYAATLTIPAGARTLSLLAQFVLEDARPVLSLSTACAIAVRNEISCPSPLPFPGALWRDPVVVSAPG
jgi:hypothetical protein